MDADAKELGHVRMALEKPLSLPRAECDHAFLHWQQCLPIGIADDASGPQQSEAPEVRVTLAADHQMVVDGDPEGLADFLRHLDVVA